MRSVLVAILFVLAPSLAHAQPSLTPVQEPDSEQPAGRQLAEQPHYLPMQAYPAPQPLQQKSEGTATMLSLGTTALGLALIAGAANDNHGDGMATLGLITLMVGPSAGHFYAGETGHAVGTSLLRGGAFLAFVVGVIKATSVAAVGADCFDCSSGSSYERDRRDGERLMWIGGLSFVALSIYDIIDGPRAVRRRNERGRGFMMAPAMVAAPSGPVPAVGLSGRF
jgi:hypothetical protein